MRICPVTPRSLYTSLLRPFLEGIERVNLAWRGVHFHQVAQTLPPIELRERIVLFSIGTTLLTPFVNQIIWIFWEIFGAPEILSDPFCPEPC